MQLIIRLKSILHRNYTMDIQANGNLVSSYANEIFHTRIHFTY
jgi:hypothetical protein